MLLITNIIDDNNLNSYAFNYKTDINFV